MPRTFIYDRPAYGPDLVREPGWIAEVGGGPFGHCFGGEKWLAEEQGVAGPHLIITLDLSDPNLDALRCSQLQSLPLFSYINNDAWLGEQIFRIHPESSLVKLVHREVGVPTLLDELDRFPNPLPEVNLHLREMTGDEYPSNEETFFTACNSFVGGNSFIRVLGPPLYLDRIELVTCLCGDPMQYVCSLGYESYGSRHFFRDRPFFFGEGALYFYFCKKCLNVNVTSQTT